MGRPRILQPGQSYTFSKYFELPSDARKQAIIAPILLEVCEITQTQLNIEYPVSGARTTKRQQGLLHQ